MLDVAAVVHELVSSVLSTRVVDSLLAPFGGPDDPQAVPRLAAAAALHDLGKASPPFQAKWDSAVSELRDRDFDINPPHDARDHGKLSAILASEVLENAGVEALAAYRIARAVAAHHGRFPSDSDLDRRPGPREIGRSSVWGRSRERITADVFQALGVEHPFVASIPKGEHAFFALLAGLVSVADWIGSMEEAFPYRAPDLETGSYWNCARTQASTAISRIGMRRAPPTSACSFVDLFRKEPWPLHQAVERAATEMDEPSLVLIEAPMGEGKTEAALLLAERRGGEGGHAGFFIGLPTQATSNQMLRRVRAFLEEAHAGEPSNLQLVHGDAPFHPDFRALVRGVYDEDERLGSVVAETWFTRRNRALLATYAVGTIDQALLGVLRARHGFVRLFGLAGKTVVLDEVHAYDAYTSEILDRLVAWLGAMGATVVLLSATLPARRRKRLLEAFTSGRPDDEPSAPYPRITVAGRRGITAVSVTPKTPAKPVRLRRLAPELSSALPTIVERVAEGGCAGLIVNTVRRAQEAFRSLLEMRGGGRIPADVELLLLHARFPAHARLERERRLEELLGPPGEGRVRPRRAIVVGTQVLEQSLDVDFDLLATDLAPVDLVLQRAGRLHRHDREDRPPHLRDAELMLLAPNGNAAEVPLADIASVYDEWVLRRTLRALEGREHVTLPREIEPLIEQTYSEDADPDLEAARSKAERRENTASFRARSRLLRSPRAEDDPFSDFGVYLEDDPNLHEDLRAETRLGGPSTEVVSVLESEEGWSLGAGMAVHPWGERPGPELTHEILRRVVKISNPTVVRGLREKACPKGWSKVSRLQGIRAISGFGAGEVVGAHLLRLDEQLGLVLELRGAK